MFSVRSNVIHSVTTNVLFIAAQKGETLKGQKLLKEVKALLSQVGCSWMIMLSLTTELKSPYRFSVLPASPHLLQV